MGLGPNAKNLPLTLPCWAKSSHRAESMCPGKPARELVPALHRWKCLEGSFSICWGGRVVVVFVGAVVVHVSGFSRVSRLSGRFWFGRCRGDRGRGSRWPLEYAIQKVAFHDAPASSQRSQVERMLHTTDPARPGEVKLFGSMPPLLAKMPAARSIWDSVMIDVRLLLSSSVIWLGLCHHSGLR